MARGQVAGGSRFTAVPGVVCVSDLAGRPRGCAFLIDHDGTLLTAHEVVDGLGRLVIHTRAGEARVVDGDAVTALPHQDLAVIRAGRLDGAPLALGPAGPGGTVRVPTHEVELPFERGPVRGAMTVTYTAVDRFHLIAGALEVGVTPASARRPDSVGLPVLDEETSAVVALTAGALDGGRETGALAVPIAPLAELPELAALLERCGQTIPAHGRHLNAAGAAWLAGAVPAGRVAGRRAALLAARVDRPEIARSLLGFAQRRDADAGPRVLALTGAPGTGRTTELVALLQARGHGRVPQPTVLLRGADLRAGDRSLGDAVDRALATPPVGDAVPLPDRPADRVAQVSAAAGRHLLVLLDSPEEMPTTLAQRLHRWAGATAGWLAHRDARLLVASRPEFWDEAVGGFGGGQVVTLGELSPEGAALARRRAGVPEHFLAPTDARHPMALTMAGELVRSRPELRAPGAGVTTEDRLGAWFDARCLACAEHLAGPDADGRRQRDLATRIAGRVHEAAQRTLAGGAGALTRGEFAEAFDGLPGAGEAVLRAGLLEPVGGGFRFRDTELGEWLAAWHLDLGAALDALVGSPGQAPDGPPTPRYRAGPVVHALLRLATDRGPDAALPMLRRLLDITFPRPASVPAQRSEEAPPPTDERAARARWWAGRLLRGALLHLPPERAYQVVLGDLVERAANRLRREEPGFFGPDFFRALCWPIDVRLGLLRPLVRAEIGPRTRALSRAAAEDGPGLEQNGFFGLAGALLADDPEQAAPSVVRWLGDETPPPASAARRAMPVRDGRLPGCGPRAPHRSATLADAAGWLLYQHRARDLDDLAERAVAAGTAGADRLLALLADSEPSALCRAVDRWSHDSRTERHIAAAVHAPRLSALPLTGADRDLLRFAAETLLSRPAEDGLAGSALAVLLRDARTRPRHLADALRCYAQGDRYLTAADLAAAWEHDPGAIADCWRDVVRTGGAGRVREVFRALAGVPDGGAERGAALVSGCLQDRPDHALAAAEFVHLRLRAGTSARTSLLPLVRRWLREEPPPVRRALVPLLVEPDHGESDRLRSELLDEFLGVETDRDNLFELIRQAARWIGVRGPEPTWTLIERAEARLAPRGSGTGRGAVTARAALDRCLLAAATRDPAFARALVDRATARVDGAEHGAPPGAGRALTELVELARRGADPRAAARAVARSARNRSRAGAGARSGGGRRRRPRSLGAAAS